LYHKSVFNHFDVIGPKATEFGEMTQHNGHYAVNVIQGHYLEYQWKACDFLLLNNTSLQPFSHRF